MKDSKEKEHRISNLKDMIDNVKDDDSIDLEEDSELIDYLNEDNDDDEFDELEIDDEFIYHPGDDTDSATNLEENPIDENYIIKTPKSDDKNDESDDLDDELANEINENFDNVVNAKIRGRPVLAIVSSILGVILIAISIFIFQSRSDRVVDNVVAGESSFMFVIFLIVGLFLLIYGVFKLFNIKNPFEKITSSIDSIDNEKDDEKDTDDTPKEKPSPKTIPKSEIPLDKESYKIGEFDMDDIKSSLKKPTSSKNKPNKKDSDDIPPAKEKSSDDVIDERMEEVDYEQAKLEGESIDDIFSEVEDIEEIPIISIDSKENEK